ncbi:hypothetical protein AALO_G00031570 [Alosa alosa]|uniref:Uncharacterized protein n=1 Tax=Alosa alosa TaxID=278164 RepID=A0AAV6HC82_9TELE|nr:hypothetical protein AALO_G00031570 [Alosa alosa]
MTSFYATFLNTEVTRKRRRERQNVCKYGFECLLVLCHCRAVSFWTEADQKGFSSCHSPLVQFLANTPSPR